VKNQDKKEVLSRRVVVMKFGGTSVGNLERLQKVADRVVSRYHEGCLPVVVVSAMGSTTDEMIELASKVMHQPAHHRLDRVFTSVEEKNEPPMRELDLLLTSGEQVSAALMAMAIQARGVKSSAFLGFQAGILTDEDHGRAKILGVSSGHVQQVVREGVLPVVAGFQGWTRDGQITTLGRGGSDTTAIALAVSLGLDECEIYTDVEGVFSADPCIVPGARKISVIDYGEMLEMAGMGAKVLQARAVEFARRYNICVHVRSSFNREEGTVVKNLEGMERPIVAGVVSSADQVRVTLTQVPDRPGIAWQVFAALADAGIPVETIVQNTAITDTTDISFIMHNEYLVESIPLIQRVSKGIGAANVVYDTEVAKISIIGGGMKGRAGVASKMFGVLAERGINISMILTSETRISCVIDRKNLDEAVRAVHDKFGLGEKQ
jgi:aspartate kinase